MLGMQQAFNNCGELGLGGSSLGKMPAAQA